MAMDENGTHLLLIAFNFFFMDGFPWQRCISLPIDLLELLTCGVLFVLCVVGLQKFDGWFW